jgi:DNA polymerase phi
LSIEEVPIQCDFFSTMEDTSDDLSKCVTSSVLDAFSGLGADDEKKRIDSAMELLKHLASRDKEGGDKETRYACSRLIRGLGSGRDSARKGYYSAFVAFLYKFDTFPMQDIFDIMNKELEMGKFSSKGEEGEVCSGRVLACGAILRSGRFIKANTAEQKYIINQIFEASKQKSYLPQLLPSFINQLLVLENKTVFKDALWPALAPVLVKPWSEQTLDSFYMLLKIINVFPSVSKKSEVKEVFGGPPVIRLDNISEFNTVLFNIKGAWHRHPVYEEVCKILGASPSLAVEFWHSSVDSQLLGPKSSRSKGSLAIEMFCFLISHLKNSDSIPHLLTPRFISLLRQRLARVPLIEDGSEEMRLEANAAFTCLTNALKLTDTSDSTRVQCLEKIVTASRGDFGFDQITKSNIIHSIALSLKFEGLICAATLCRAVISGESHPCKGDDEESNDSLPTNWLNKDRISAIHLLATLATHPAATSDFQSEQTLVLVEHAFFPPPGCTSLCLAAKEGLLRCVAVTSPSGDPLATMRGQLSHVVSFINNKLTNGQKPYKASKEVLDSWKKMMTAIGKLKGILSTDDKKSKGSSEKNLSSVLLVLFMQLGLQLFLDPELALDSLEELHLCVEKAGLTKQKISKNVNEPHWVEVVTDLFLSLLSQSSSMLRSIVNRVFSALCPLMTQSALLNLVQVVDCSNESNPLSVRSEASEPNESVVDEDQEDSSDMEEDEEDRSDEEEEELEQDTVSDRVRAAVRDALGDAAEVTDTESVDVDDIGEEEGQKLDEALSQAFSVLRKGGSKTHMTKKQSRDSKDLVHFRVRVMDLIDTYMHSEQSLYLVCCMIAPLFHALEACLKDVNQKPLESRLRNSLRKLSTVKKFVNLENVDGDTITSLLQSLIAKGDRTAAVFLDVSHEVCVVSGFLVKSSQLLTDHNPAIEQQISNIYVMALNNFFDKRDCLLPPVFFSLVLKTMWNGNFILWPHLASAAFENKTVRPFRKIQALTLLREFTSNEKLLSQHPDEKIKLGTSLSMLAGEMLSGQAESNNETTSIKPRLLKELLLLLIVVHQHCNENVDWGNFRAALTRYIQSNKLFQLSREIKNLFKKLQNKLSISTNIDEVKKVEFQFAKPKPVVNGISEKSPKIKKRKSEQNKSKNSEQLQEKVAKRRAKEMRLNSLSDGLDNEMNFSAINLESGFEEN